MLTIARIRLRNIAVLLGVGALAFTVSACAGESGTREFTVYQKPPILVPDPDSDSDGSRTGAELFFAADLTDEEGTANGRVMGQVTTIDVTIDGQLEEDRFRELVFDLSTGQIIVLGASEYIASDPLSPDFADDNAPVTAVIVGGTGEYEGVRGTVVTTRLDDGTYEHDFTVQQ